MPPKTAHYVHGEADGLPGIHVDLYDDVATVRYDGTEGELYNLADVFQAFADADVRDGDGPLVRRG